MPEELKTEVHDVLQEAVIKTIPEKKKGKWLSDKGLQIAEKRQGKGKGEKERYTHLNAKCLLVDSIMSDYLKKRVQKYYFFPLFAIPFVHL